MSEKTAGSHPNAAAAFLLCAVAAAAPLPFGSSDMQSVALWCAILGLTALVASPCGLRRPHLLLLVGLAGLTAAYGFVVTEQIAAYPRYASPHDIWGRAADLLGISLPATISVVPREAKFGIGRPLVAILALVCGLMVGADRSRARQLLWVIAISGSAYAVYGIVSFGFFPTSLLGSPKDAYLSSLTGTFINRNTAAVYFGSCVIVWLLLLSERLRRRLPTGPVRCVSVTHCLSRRLTLRTAAECAALTACTLALFLTGSRAGVALTLLVILIGAVLFWRRFVPDGRRVRQTIIATTGLAIILLLHFMGGLVSVRFSEQGLADEGRLSAYRSTLRMIGDHPWLGSGLGSFAWLFPSYRSGDISMWGSWDVAHSTPLELAAELGLPLAATIVVAWLIALAVLVHGIKVRRRDRVIPLVAFSISLLALLHSMIDFSLQISGYAIVVFSLAGIGLAQSLNASHAKRAE